MQFTREPIIETIITPKEGYKLVVRSSKTTAQEEFSVDAVQLITIGHNCFYRSLEKPKAFFVPAGDYEILEVRETRVQLKIPGKETGGIKIAGGREASMKPPKEAPKVEEEKPVVAGEAQTAERHEKRRKRFRKRHKDDPESTAPSTGEKSSSESVPEEKQPAFVIPPPSTLISESISRYREIPDFKGAFFAKEEESIIVESEPLELPFPPLEEERNNEHQDREELSEEGRDFLSS